jgi:vacuole morphology and inheritance protein 14
VTSTVATRSKIGQPGDIKWQELLGHFRAVQTKHEKARRQALGVDGLAFSGFDTPKSSGDASSTGSGSGAGSGPGSSMRRRVTGTDPTPTPTPPPGTGTGVPSRPVLSPLNPRARQNGLLSTAMMGQGAQSFSGSVMGAGSASGSSSLAMQQQRQRRPGPPVTLGPRKP